ncbi:tyrosine-type recombinase/integrase [Qipengyuania gelatinilytica]|uniref:tyrosine-type recombinase/integrase n=1 Tax=Qipengyuania gelatinilytica TaxID=2867231 RepID=UPI001FFDC748|nr:tyrosine-type recombinase/integrase [Qipengyuania gelatinilytica]
MASNYRLGILTAFFNFCLDNCYGGLVWDPTRGVKKIRITNSKISRVLSLREMALAVVAARELDRRNTADGKVSTWADYITLLCLTGCRKSEIYEAMCKEYDPKTGVFTISPERYKTSMNASLPLGPTGRAIFKRHCKRGETFILPYQSGIRTGQDAHMIEKVTDIMSELAGETIERWTPHSLRYSFRSNIRKAKIADSELADKLIHPLRKEQFSQHYDPDFFDEKREALEAWDKRLNEEIEAVVAERIAAVA